MAKKPKAERRKVRVVVSMHGGTIDAVYLERKDQDLELDMVFTEDMKYLGEDREFEVEKGPLQGEGIYTHMEGSYDSKEEDKQASVELFEGVFAAAQARLDADKEDDADDSETEEET